MIRRGLSLVVGIGSVVFWTCASAQAQTFQQSTLISSATDPDLINPWGMSFSATSPFWVSDNGTGKSTLYNSAGVKQGLVVSMPGGSEPVTGNVFNGTSTFQGNTFLFASENGTIAGWRGALGTTAEQLYAVPGGVYKGLAISTTKDTLYAANFHSGAIDVFSSIGGGLTGSFSDPSIPAGYAPFNIQNLGGRIYTTFAKQDAAMHDDVAGAGFGFVDVFDPTAHTFSRLVSGGQLNSPWGVALAPAGFGSFAGALLVGNFGDGLINAFDATSGAFLGTLRDASNNPIVNLGLWGLTAGNGGNGGDAASLYLTAGGPNEDAGLLARISVVPAPNAALVLLGGLGTTCGFVGRRRRCGAASR